MTTNLRLYSNISKLLLLYKAWGVLWEIKLYKILGDILLICQNTVYSRYIAVVYIAELDILRSHVGPHFLAPKSWIFFEIVVTPWTQFAGDNRKQFFAKSTAVRWAAMLDTSIVSQSKVQLIHCQCKSRLQIANLGINNAFLAATKQLYEWYFLSARLSLSVTPFWLCSHHRIIMKFSGVITKDQGNDHAKGQGQRSKVKVTTQLNRFRIVTPVWIHIWWWNDTYSLMLLRRGALLFFKVIR